MLKNFTLLYVDDDQMMQENMGFILQSRVKHLYQAKNGEEGLKIFKEKKPDIIVTDVCMPLLNGLDMSEKIKKENEETPILMISGFEDTENLIKAINIGVDYFIPKPIDIDLFLNRLNMIAKNLQNNIDAKKAKEKELYTLKKLAYYDTLTGILNRFSFDESLEKILNNKNEKFALFFIDLDNFKLINDTYGHKVGDKVLQNIASNIKSVIRKNDVFARISGDEFALILRNINDTNLDMIANKIIQAVYKDIKVGDEVINMGCSIGISLYPQDAKTKKDLIHFADIAMYEAKKSGKSTYRYFSNTSFNNLIKGEL
jgi:diguanylate cyclase (GGDEF)-like protein